MWFSYPNHSTKFSIPTQQNVMVLWRKDACAEGEAIYGSDYISESKIIKRSDVISKPHNAEMQLSARWL